MSQYTNTFLALPEFECTGEPTIRHHKGIEVTTVYGKMTGKRPETCPTCGSAGLHVHQRHSIRLKHLAVGDALMEIEVTYVRWLCLACAALVSQHIPFRQEQHLVTKTYHRQMTGLLERGAVSLAHVASIMHSNKNLVRAVDKRRLMNKAGDMKPTHYSRFIGVDEFSLHRRHQYATVVIDLETGESLFVEAGNGELQMHHFFSFVGRDFMNHVQAVAMDMNAQYAAAVRARFPHVSIVYDPFHIIKNYNDRVVSELRRAEQRRLTEAMDQARRNGDRELAEHLVAEYRMFKGSRFVLLSNRRTLAAKDTAAREHNRMLYERFERKGLALPPGERKWPTTHLARLEQVLQTNEKLQTVYVLAEMLKLSFTCTRPDECRQSLALWLKTAHHARIPELEGFCKMIRKHFQGVANHARYPISNGPLEGTNNLIKTIRRQAFGYRDQHYFFLKIWEATRKHPKNRSFISHSFRA
ncbi:MAG: ISL3 family transposase [Anaerovoracaceae bacterium]